MARRPKLELVAATDAADAQRVEVPSARLVTIDETDPLWASGETAEMQVQVRGALVRLVPPSEMTIVAVGQVRDFLLKLGAVAVRIQPNRKRATNANTGDRSPVVPTVRAVVGAMVDSAHCDDFGRDELRDAVETALCQEGI